MLIVIFFYSVIGCILFSGVKKGVEINATSVNFLTFSNAAITLFRCSTGEDWYVIMFDLSKTEDKCTQGKDCGSSKFIK